MITRRKIMSCIGLGFLFPANDAIANASAANTDVYKDLPAIKENLPVLREFCTQIDGMTTFYKEFFEDGIIIQRIHRDNDLPAVVYKYGDKYWYQNGEIHRDGDKPAMVLSSGIQIWKQHGIIHRGDDKPAHIYPNVFQEWYSNGELHREGGKPARVFHNGDREWYINGEFVSSSPTDIERELSQKVDKAISSWTGDFSGSR